MSYSQPVKPITLMVVDDHPLLRAGVAAVVSRSAEIELIGEASNGHDAIALFRDLRPDVTLMSIKTPIRRGIAAIETIITEFPQAQIAIVSTNRDGAPALLGIEAGARALLLKSTLSKELVGTLCALAAGRRCLPLEIRVDLNTREGQKVLSARERQVLNWVAKGRSNREVAQLLSISEATVKGHLRNIMDRLGALNRTHAVTMGLQRGIIVLEH